MKIVIMPYLLEVNPILNKDNIEKEFLKQQKLPLLNKPEQGDCENLQKKN